MFRLRSIDSEYLKVQIVLEIPESIFMADLGNNPLYKLRFRGEPTNLVRLEVRNTHLKSLYAKINPECLIDVHGTPLMLSGHLSKEVRTTIYTNMYNGEGYNMDDWRRKII